MSAELVIRPAHAGDLQRIWDIRYQNDVFGEIDPPAQEQIPPYLPHLLATADLRVAKRDGRVLGYSGATERSGVTYLNDLFVDPTEQSGKLGQALLQATIPMDDAPKCVLASTDFRALALYARFGMPPRWPNYDVEAPSTALTFSLDDDIELVPVDAADAELITLDAQTSGRRRPKDLHYWQTHEKGALFLCRRHGEIVGYAVARFAAARTWHPEAVVIGPVGARDPNDAAACLVAITRWAAARAPFVQLAIPGPHPGLVPLLASGLKMVYTQTYGSSDARIVDPERYVGSGGDLF